MLRLAESHAVQAEPPSVFSRLTHTCIECGTAYEAEKRTSTFCCLPCQKTWNNRRLTRGAQIYDLFMAFRFDRANARTFRVLSMMNRLASIYREEDRRQRNARPSWNAPAIVAERAPHLRATILQRAAS